MLHITNQPKPWPKTKKLKKIQSTEKKTKRCDKMRHTHACCVAFTRRKAAAQWKHVFKAITLYTHLPWKYVSRSHSFYAKGRVIWGLYTGSEMGDEKGYIGGIMSGYHMPAPFSSAPTKLFREGDFVAWKLGLIECKIIDDYTISWQRGSKSEKVLPMEFTHWRLKNRRSPPSMCSKKTEMILSKRAKNNFHLVSTD